MHVHYIPLFPSNHYESLVKPLRENQTKNNTKKSGFYDCKMTV